MMECAADDPENKFRKQGSSLHSPYFFVIFATVLHQKRFIKRKWSKKRQLPKGFSKTCFQLIPLVIFSFSAELPDTTALTP